MTRARITRIAWAAGGIGVAGSIAGWILDPAAFAYAWLAATVFAIGWPLGSLALIYIHALTGGRWGLALREPLVSGTISLAIVVPAMLPVALLADLLYPWMHPFGAAGLLNGWYLNPAFFYGRGAACAVIWLALGGLTLAVLRRADPQPWLYRIAPPALILLVLTVTFAAVDSTLSLEPRFKSSVYGMLMSTEGILFALSVATLILLTTTPTEPAVREDLGKLILAFTVLWAYLDFMQFLIVWNSDLPGEAAWYVHRITGGWAWVAGLIALLHFFIPFFVLLWPQMQRSRRVLITVAAMMVAVEIPRAWWLVLPSSPRGFNWIDVVAMLAVGGLAAGVSLSAPRPHIVSHKAQQSHA